MFLPKYKEVNPPPIGNKELIKPIISRQRADRGKDGIAHRNLQLLSNQAIFHLKEQIKIL